MTGSHTLTLTIDGMHCGACVRRVTQALAGVPGVAVQQVDIGTASVTFDPQQSTSAAIAAAVDRIGFTVTGTKE